MRAASNEEGVLRFKVDMPLVTECVVLVLVRFFMVGEFLTSE
jgi:hypothetical protein